MLSARNLKSSLSNRAVGMNFLTNYGQRELFPLLFFFETNNIGIIVGSNSQEVDLGRRIRLTK